MKKFYSVLMFFVIAFFIMGCNKAKTADGNSGAINSYNFNGTVFELKWSDCNGKKPVCQNEYYKKDEKGMGWSELLTIMYHKDTNYHNDMINKKGLLKKAYQVNATYETKDNHDLLYFMIPFSYNGSRYAELDCAKYMQSQNDSIAIQLAKRIKLDGKTKNEIRKEISVYNAKCEVMLEVLPPNLVNIHQEELQKW